MAVPPCARASRRRPGTTAAEAGLAPDLGEVDDGDRGLLGHLTVVQLAEEVGELVDVPDLRVVVLDLARRDLLQLLHLDLVDDGVEDLLAHAEALAHEHAHDLTLLVLPALVAETDRRRLAVVAQLVGDDRGVEVEGVHAACIITRPAGVEPGGSARRGCATVGPCDGSRVRSTGWSSSTPS